MNNYKYIRTILILIPILILGILLYCHICPSGNLKVNYDFCAEDPFVSKFSPIGRVLEIEKYKNYCQQKMVIDPVYFDIRLPQSFQSANLKIWYKKNDNTVLKIGPRFNPNEWLWDLKNIEFKEKENEWDIGATKFDLNHTTMENNRLRFLISSPGLDQSGKEIIFKKIEIEFKKDPLSIKKIITKLK